MRDSFVEVLSFQFKRLVPVSFSVLLVLISCIPYHFVFSKYIIADVSLMCVYFWASYRRDLFGIGSAFFLGLITDCLSLSPIGLNVMANMTAFLLTNIFRGYVNTRAFTVSWSGFALVALGAYAFKWLVASFYYSTFLPLPGICLGYATTLLLYPLIARINIFVQNWLLSEEEAVYEQG